ncbi:Cell division protein FtsQ [Saliniradius amylolyticus]|uniref:Cell division protein FtsQ n=1 Tax=Saliniradius amylolyticus TaxID=2183582 RepID=A0A2S2E5P5_9ALTE|nr:cell division protein FtsQ/DivIB [Saliniradius amylolyticus]AWL12919.1 Cell division protein FtsQ [Saliniradius amylolyticus]
MTAHGSQTGSQFWSGLVFFLLVLLGLGYGFWQLQQWLEDEQRLPVETIKLSGQVQQVTQAQVDKVVRQGQPGSFFELDVQQALADIEALPWVYRASVRKEWPNHLRVHVVEQQAVAVWNGELLLNRYGDSFSALLPPEAKDWPRLYGPEGSEQTALQGYRAMSSLLQGLQLGIKELVLTERFAWSLTLDSGLKIKLGRSEFIDRLQRLVDLYPLLEKDKRQADYVDIRYDTGLAVGWKDKASDQQQEQ